MSEAEDLPAPLRREVRHLGSLLGRVIEEAEGADLLEEVERLRRATIAQRREPSDEHRRRAIELAWAMEPARSPSTSSS